MGFLDMKAAFSAGGLSIAPARLCDSCQSSTAVIFCRVDSAFLCISCDSKLHSFNKMTHARVWMCEVCEQAPAAFTCKADAAALCVQCDFDIHSANPLARRHERVPVEPFYDSASAAADDSAVVKSSALDFFGGHGSGSSDLGSQSCDLDAPNWNMNSSNSKLLGNSVKNGDLFFSEMDNFLDFEFQSYQQHQQDITADSVVPAPPTKPTYAVPKATLINHSSENCFEIDFGRSKISPFNLSNHSITQSVSSSEIGVVSDGNSMSEISHPFGRNASSVPDSCVSGSTNQICGLDREARVLRYREKRKNRKFEKTIRYASRKAYAETRPRIKGRFAKRTEIGSEIDQIYGSSSPVAFGVVPTF